MTAATTETEPGRVRPFADILRDLKRGEVIDEAAILLQDLVRAVVVNGKKGTFTLKVEVSPMKGDSTALVVAAQASISPPKGQPAEAVFFADRDNNLVRDDPNQIALPGLRRVDIDSPSPKEIAK
ncbi:hypothetical protein [Microtetraspora niveoalba]|uniref:hypothetical protein n=1 Tax=Microtetraspora niveoalba TaxID=46175 RepID=UPI00082A3BF5|nr:hypothetical protein [Microtetraspora niveoalba]